MHPNFLSETCEGLSCEALFINTLQVVQMANKDSRREGKETCEKEIAMTLRMKMMYKDFTSQFQKLNSRLDKMDKWRREMT